MPVAGRKSTIAELRTAQTDNIQLGKQSSFGVVLASGWWEVEVELAFNLKFRVLSRCYTTELTCSVPTSGICAEAATVFSHNFSTTCYYLAWPTEAIIWGTGDRLIWYGFPGRSLESEYWKKLCWIWEVCPRSCSVRWGQEKVYKVQDGESISSRSEIAMQYGCKVWYELAKALSWGHVALCSGKNFWRNQKTRLEKNRNELPQNRFAAKRILEPYWDQSSLSLLWAEQVLQESDRQTRPLVKRRNRFLVLRLHIPQFLYNLTISERWFW